MRHGGELLRVQLQGPAVSGTVRTGQVGNEQLQHRHVPAIKKRRDDDDDDDDDDKNNNEEYEVYNK